MMRPYNNQQKGASGHFRWPERWMTLVVAAVSSLVLLLVVFKTLDDAFPPKLDKLQQRSVIVNDRNGQLLRAFTATDGRWRLPIEIKQVDPRFLTLLLAYEDQRYYQHSGVDLLALIRASGQLLWSGHIVSGASTLTMQVVRLLDGPQPRSLMTKVVQIFRAIQLEQHFSKARILQAYLHLAPYGGNLEGVRAASLAYFGKEPIRLSVAEAALLVALPQSPESRRPDRHRAAAQAARNRVLHRMVTEKVLATDEVLQAEQTWVHARRLKLPAFAAHAAVAVQRNDATRQVYRLSIDRKLQQQSEQLLRERAADFDPGVSLALMVADPASGEILADVGSPDYFDRRRLGEIDMTRSRRSPGSTLKPLIYGIAFEQGVVAPASLIDDTPVSFAGYRPRNFDLAYQGTVTVTDALQRSLNVPAIKLLDAVGPQALLSRMQRAGITVDLPTSKPAGLAIGLGGLGLSMRDLLQLYSAMARGGQAVALHENLDQQVAVLTEPLLQPLANRDVLDILRAVPRPAGVKQSGNIAWKTGTSYGYRDAWSIGFDGRYVIAVWVGRPDGAPVPGITGAGTAAPILFSAFQRMSPEIVALPEAPPGAVHLTTSQLPGTLAHFVPHGQLMAAREQTSPPPVIVYPPTGARIELGWSDEKPDTPLFLKLQGGKPPFRWLANGKPIAGLSRRRQMTWLPDSAGFSTLTVLDAAGRPARIRVFLQ